MEDNKLTPDDFKRYLELVDFMLNSARRLQQSCEMLRNFLKTSYESKNK